MSKVPTSLSERVAAMAREMAGDNPAALAGLFDLTSLRLVRYATAITRHQQDAEDAVQAALLRLVAQPTMFAAAGQPWHYLLRTVRNEALQVLRRKRRRALLNGLADLIWNRTVDSSEQHETQQAVWNALRRLPAEQAEVVVLKVWEALTFAEIGRVLGKSPHTVASRYQYAMRRLEHQLRLVYRESLR